MQEDVKTPFLDALAAEGVRYENAYSACPTCVPARATLYTGMSQEHTGRVGYEDLVPWDYPHTLAGELSKAGSVMTTVAACSFFSCKTRIASIQYFPSTITKNTSPFHLYH